ncbi:MAG TPA: hypothetical protein VMZ28_05930 [Kofleriaceae bacterium]|nr:hypothetical protein [Kofleriaceae bacterium]
MRAGRERDATVKMEALQQARLAAPVEIHDVPTARMTALQLDEAIAASIAPRTRMARGSSGHEVALEEDTFLFGVPMVRTFAARHPWLVTAAALAVTVLLLLALHGSAGP